MTNRLRIDADQLHLELTGDSEAICQSYEMARELLVRSFQEQFTKVEEEKRRAAQPAAIDPQGGRRQEGEPRAKATEPKGFSLQDWRPPEGAESTHISVVFCSSFYHKVCSLERDEFDASPFGEVFHFEKIGRVYLRHDQQPNFKPYFHVGKVLWRELTKQGFAAVRKGP